MKKHYSNIVRLLSVSLIIISTSDIALSLWEYFTYKSVAIPTITILLGLLGLIIGIVMIVRRHIGIHHAYDHLDDEERDDTTHMLLTFPRPCAIMHIDGSIIWVNTAFEQIISSDKVYGKSITDFFPEVKWGDVLKTKSKFKRYASFNGRTYQIEGSIYTDKTHKTSTDKYSVYMYFYDITDSILLSERYNNEATDVAYISVDNYENVSGKIEEGEAESPFFRLGRLINDFAKSGAIVVKKISNDKYFLVFEHASLNGLIDAKFAILQSARELAEEFNLPMSLSIGIGTGGSIAENDANAKNALELAIGRGGDQACVKDDSQYNFYGGKTREYEKSTKLRTKAIASALRDFILQADNVVIMGHRGIDYDAFGAGIGLAVACRAMDRRVNLVYDHLHAVEPIARELSTLPEYDDLLIQANEVEEIVNERTLLIIIDTSRPTLLPAKELANKTDKIVVLDHHRRSTEFLEKVSLQYIEPFASSTCEMVTELVQFMTSSAKFTPFEAKCLYMGILMDTKNFTLKTVVRTFEAASYLRACGLDTVSVKKNFQVSKNDYLVKAKIISEAKLVTYNIAVSVYSRLEDNIREICAQASDEMLSLSNVEAAFVVYPFENGRVGISGRSLGEINVQLILEKLGGGGHQSVAGAQLEGSMSNAHNLLLDAIEEYEKENES